MSYLIVFAKEPKAGFVKTRLQPFLTAAQSCSLYKAFLKDTVVVGNSVRCDKKIMAYESCGSPFFLKSIARDYLFYKQKGRTLGQKMDNAFNFVLNNKKGKAVIIGSDLPTLPGSYVKQAFTLLNLHDVVLGPSFDGGYYLIGLKTPCKELFTNIAWSSKSVFINTLAKAERLHLKTACLPPWYDVDNPQNLLLLLNELKNQKGPIKASHTKKILQIMVERGL